MSLEYPVDATTMATKLATAAVDAGSSETTTTSTSASTIKTVYLIRHAESEENRRIASLSRCFKKLTKFSLPTSSDLVASAELINVKAQVDSNVSEIGEKQISNMGNKLRQVDFVNTEGLQLIVHSPLLRARQTCEGLLGVVAPKPSSTTSTSEVNDDMTTEKKEEETSTKSSSTPKQNSPDRRVIELDLLLEKTPQEWTPLYYNGFIQRINTFESWLANQPESVIGIVGHSQFFKAMLQLDFKFNNCDVYKFHFDISKKNQQKDDDNSVEGSITGAAGGVEPAATAATSETSTTWKLPPQWSNMTLLHKCEVESSKKDID